MRSRISIRRYVRPSVAPSVRPSVGHTRVEFLIGKNRIEDSRFFHILKKRAFPFFGQTILGKLSKNLNWMSLRMKLTGVKPQYVMDVHQKFECSIFNGSRDITLGTSKGQIFSFNLFVSISVSFSLRGSSGPGGWGVRSSWFSKYMSIKYHLFSSYGSFFSRSLASHRNNLILLFFTVLKPLYRVWKSRKKSKIIFFY